MKLVIFEIDGTLTQTNGVDSGCFIEAIKEVPGARSFLEHLESSPDYPVAFATGAHEASARYKLVTAGFSIEGMPLASSSDAVVREHIMLQARDRAAQRHGVPFTGITYFGDAVWDINASSNLGWDFIGIGPGITEGVRFDDYRDPNAILQAL